MAKGATKKTASKQEVSIIIPVYNRAKMIKKCLESLIRQKAGFPFEIILVDDGSKDGTVKVLKRWEKKFPGKIKVLEKRKNEGQSKARNFGIKAAKGNIMVFTDSDCIARPGWLKKLTARIRSGEVKVAQGYSVGEVSNIWQKIIQESYDSFIRGMVKNNYVNGFDTRNSAAVKEVFEKIGFFETRYAEDADLGARIIAAGYKIAFMSNAIIFHYHRKELLKDLRANYLISCYYPLIIKKNWYLIKAQPGIPLRIAYGLMLILLLLGMPLWLQLFPLFFFVGILVVAAAIVARSFYRPFSLVPFRIIYFAASAVATAVGFGIGLIYLLRKYEPEGTS